MFFLKYIFGLRDKSAPEADMSFLDHLEALRSMLLKMVVTLFVAMLLCFNFSGDILNFLRAPVENVWSQFESSHLPSQVSAKDWMEAKQCAEVMPLLNEEEAQSFLRFKSFEMRRLIKCVTLMKAEQLLPEHHWNVFEKEAKVTSSVRDLLKELRTSGALLGGEERKSGSQMMSALEPAESFNLSLKVALYAGGVISLPLLILFLLQFVLPGLEDSEKTMLFKAMGVGTALFVMGASFAYWVVLPQILGFFFEYSMQMGISNDWRIGLYLTFVLQFIVLFGVSFELPVVVMPFVKLGILTYDMMRASRRYAVVIIAIVSAIVTPQDILSMVMMALPMLALYEICIFLAYRDQKLRQKEDSLNETMDDTRHMDFPQELMKGEDDE